MKTYTVLKKTTNYELFVVTASSVERAEEIISLESTYLTDESVSSILPAIPKEVTITAVLHKEDS